MTTTTGLHWTYKSLEDSPRLHLSSDNTNGSYNISSTDDVVLYNLTDARYLDTTDPSYSTPKEYWRCFLKDREGSSVAEFRRHIDPASAVGMTIRHRTGKEGIRTGLELVSSSRGSIRYRLTWVDQGVFFFETTRQAPNTSSSSEGSLRCTNSSGAVLAWLTRSEQRDVDQFSGSTSQTAATIWFEVDAGGIDIDLIEMIISGLSTITDVQFPIRLLKS